MHAHINHKFQHLCHLQSISKISMFDIYIASHASEIDQYTVMLSARLLQIDHSFKVLKHLAHLNCVPVFKALHGSVNEYAEI